MPKSQNVRIVESLYAAFAQGNIQAVLDVFDEQIEWQSAENSPYAAGPLRGKQAVLDGVFARLARDWESFRVTPREYLDAGDSVIALGRYSGTHRNTGRQILPQFAHLWDIQGGRIVRYRQYTDTLQLAEAYGLAAKTAMSASAAH